VTAALEALRAALAAGPTPGPWACERAVNFPTGWIVRKVNGPLPTSMVAVVGVFGEGTEADADLIAAACNAAPDLLAEVDRLKAEREALLQTLEHVAQQARRAVQASAELAALKEQA
jgi:hypothetical protein